MNFFESQTTVVQFQHICIVTFRGARHCLFCVLIFAAAHESLVSLHDFERILFDHLCSRAWKRMFTIAAIVAVAEIAARISCTIPNSCDSCNCYNACSAMAAIVVIVAIALLGCLETSCEEYRLAIPPRMNCAWTAHENKQVSTHMLYKQRGPFKTPLQSLLAQEYGCCLSLCLSFSPSLCCQMYVCI